MIENIIKDYALKIEKSIDELFPYIESDYKELINASRYSLLLGGKRIRPILLIEFCKLCGGDYDDAINFAVALEMIHTYSLIHDDLPCMDNDDMRRGKPSCHKKYSESTALLAGDTLLTEAFKVASKSNLPADRIVKAIEVLSSLSGLHGMIGGQMLDLNFESFAPNAEQLIDMYSKKTSGLLIAASKMGCIAAGKLDDDTLNNAYIFSNNLGIAFQIIDDILDYTADEELLGKPVGSDEKNGKTTIVSIYGLDKSKQLAKDYTSSALEALDNLNGDKTVLKELTNYLLDRKF